MAQDTITFSFGKNWRDYVETVAEDALRGAMNDIVEWLGRERVADKTVLDIGCGSGIHSLCFHTLGAREVFSFDVDPYSVESTRLLWEKAGRPANWSVNHGSILDDDFLGRLGAYDIVYSWGVLHHTGAMWQAIDHASSRVKPGGSFWIALYVKGPHYEEHLALKRKYNRASWLGKKWMVWKDIFGIMRERRRAGQNPFAWNQRGMRGMNTYHDLVDWLGGLPYEVASRDEVVDFCAERGFALEKFVDSAEGGNSIYVFSRTAPVQNK